MNYYSNMNYNKENFNRILSKKIAKKLVTATSIMVGLSLIDKVL